MYFWWFMAFGSTVGAGIFHVERVMSKFMADPNYYNLTSKVNQLIIRLPDVPMRVANVLILCLLGLFQGWAIAVSPFLGSVVSVGLVVLAGFRIREAVRGPKTAPGA